MDKIAPEMQETMQRLIKIERIAEEIESLRVQNLTFNEKKEKNRAKTEGCRPQDALNEGCRRKNPQT